MAAPDPTRGHSTFGLRSPAADIEGFAECGIAIVDYVCEPLQVTQIIEEQSCRICDHEIGRDAVEEWSMVIRIVCPRYPRRASNRLRSSWMENIRTQNRRVRI